MKPYDLVVLDLDGVLADFTGACCKLFDKPNDVDKWDFFKEWGLSAEEFWKTVHGQGPHFYRDLVDPIPGLNEVTEAAETLGDRVVIMTSPSDHPNSYYGKKEWCDLYFPGTELIVGSAKELLAGPRSLLIDDNERNVEKFREHGGHAVLHPQPWNKNRYLDLYAACQKDLLHNASV